MRIIIVITFFFTLINSSLGQSTRQLIKDFDGDKKNDTIYIDSDLHRLICKLSTDNYVKNESNTIKILNFGNTLVATDKGFEFWNNYDRSEYINEFQYNTDLKKMQLIKITRHENNGATKGKSTINLLTNEYVGNFTYCKNYEHGAKNVYDSLATIKKKIILPQTFLGTFSDLINYDYEKQCVALLNTVIENEK